MSDVQSQVARYQPKAALTDAQLLALAARAWHDFGIALIRADDLDNAFDRLAVSNAAEKLYGKRSNH